MNKTLLLLLSAILLSTTSCKKDNSVIEEKLPPETQMGANTFGCLVNGKVWNASIGNNLVPKINIDYYTATQVNIFASRTDLPGNANSVTSITFSINNDSIKPGLYYLNDTAKRHGSFNSDKQACNYQTNSSSGDKLEITKNDTQNHIISGRFEMHFAAQNNCGAIDITLGRFDIKY